MLRRISLLFVTIALSVSHAAVAQNTTPNPAAPPLARTFPDPASETPKKSAMPIVLINPEVEVRGETEIGVEGCLSFPEITGDIERPQSVLVRAQTLEGEMFQIEASGLLARAIQHEHDHLHGILFIDRMSSAAKAALSSRLKRLQKETNRGVRHHEEVVSETTL